MAEYQFSLADVRTRVRTFLMQSNAEGSRWADADIDTFINTALDDLRLQGVGETARVTEASAEGDRELVLPDDVWKVLHITYDGQWLKQITMDDLLRMTGGDFSTGTGTPAYFAVEVDYDADEDEEGTRIRFDCACSESDKDIVVWYLRRPEDLTEEDDDALVGLYKAFTPLLVYRVLVLCAKTDGNRQEAQDWDAEYQRALEAAQRETDNRAESDAPQAWDPYGWSG